MEAGTNRLWKEPSSRWGQVGRCDARSVGQTLSDLVAPWSLGSLVLPAELGPFPGLERQTLAPVAAQTPACPSLWAGMSRAGGQGAPWEAGLGAHTSKPVDFCCV